MRLGKGIFPCFWVATTLLVAGLTLTLWIIGQIYSCLHPPAGTQASFKGCLYNVKWLAYGLFQLMHMTHDDHTVRSSQVSAMVARRKTKIIIVLTTSPQGCILAHKSVKARWGLWQCGHNLCGPFLRTMLPMTAGSGAQAMMSNRKKKGLRTPPPRWISDMFESVQNGDQDGVVRIFVGFSYKLWGFLITLNYNAQHSFLYTRSVINF